MVTRAFKPDRVEPVRASDLVKEEEKQPSMATTLSTLERASEAFGLLVKSMAALNARVDRVERKIDKLIKALGELPSAVS